MTRKRTIEESAANEEDDSTTTDSRPRSSRMVRLEESRARARLAMGVQAPTKKSPARSSSSKRKPVARPVATRRTPSRAAKVKSSPARTGTLRSSAVKKRKQSAQEPQLDGDTEDESSKTPAPKKRRLEKREEGKKKAALWNEAQNKKPPAENKRRGPVLSNITIDTNPNEEEPPPPVETPKNLHQPAPAPVPPAPTPPPPPPVPPTTPATATAPPAVNTSEPWDWQQRHFASKTAEESLNNQDNDHIPPPPPPNFQYTATTTPPQEMPTQRVQPPMQRPVFNNVHVSPPAPAFRPRREIADPIDQEVMEVYEENDEYYSDGPRSWWLLFAGLAALLSVAVALTCSSNEGIFSIASLAVTPQEPYLPPCFQDTHPDIITTADEKNTGSPSCRIDPQLGILPCPDKGICSGGVLQECNDPNHYVVIDNACRLNAEANATLDAIESLLIAWTTDHICSFEGCPHVIQDQEPARFALITVFEELNLPCDVVPPKIGSRPSLVVEVQENDLWVVGLSEDYVDHQMELPWPCWLSTTLKAIALFSFSLLWSWISYVCWVVASCFRSRPLWCLAGTAVLYVATWIYSVKRERHALLNQIASARCRVMQQLATHKKHRASDLRESIAYELYPYSRLERNRFAKKIWPKVVLDIREDTRVLKSIEPDEQGMLRDVWTWVAAIPPTPNHVY